jgi:5-(carboxyamino)imidazole ribonucleotide mutase
MRKLPQKPLQKVVCTGLMARVDDTRPGVQAPPMNASPLVGIIMGSTSDWPTMEHAARTLRDFGVSWEAEVVSAHRTPDKLVSYASEARGRGLKCIIAGAGGAAHLPGMTAAITDLPVLGIPVESKALQGVDSLLSIVQMPAGIPTATFAIGRAGAVNAALFAVAMLANESPALAEKLAAFRAQQSATVKAAVLPDLA